MSLKPGTRVGPYEILGPLGAGGMGEVYRANDARLSREVAIKVLPSRIAGDEGFLGRFEREAKAVAALSHPGILAIFDFGTHDGLAYAVTELLEGETLRARLASGALPARKAVDLAVQIARGLAAAHDKGIVHRDLKPENLFVTRDGRVKILDFGLARSTEAPTAANATQTPTRVELTSPGAVLGTVGYMSPEQVRGAAADARSDIFSLGCVLHEMLTGKRAFDKDTPAETMTAILHEDPAPPPAGSAPVSGPLRAILDRCLEKDPGERFRSAHDLAIALESAMSASSASSPDTTRGSAPAPRGIRGGPMWAAAAALLLLGAAIPYLLHRLGPAKVPSSPRSLSFQPITFQQITIFRAQFAPDGRTIVFSAALSGNTPELFTVSLDFPEPRSLDLPGTQFLSVSRKGELAVLTGARHLNHRLFEGTLARVPMSGGAPREIQEGVREADWTPDGEDLAIVRSVEGQDRLECPLGAVLARGTGYLSDVRVSHDGRHIAFFEHPLRYDDRGVLVVIDRKGGTTYRSPAFTRLEGLAWSADDRELIFGGVKDQHQLTIFSATLSGEIREALSAPGNLIAFDVASDGRWIVAVEDRHREVRGRGPGAPREVPLSWFDNTFPSAISADGRTLIFTEQADVVGGNYAVGSRKTDGSPIVRLGEGQSYDLSPDGKWVAAAIPGPPEKLVLYPTGAGQSRQLEAAGLASFADARFSPDGKTLYVAASEVGHARRYYALDLAGGKPRPVTAEGTTTGRLSPDGRTFIARSLDSYTFALYPVDGGASTPLPFLTPNDVVSRWTADGRGVFAYRYGDVPTPLERVDLATGRRERVLDIAPPDLAGAMRVTVVVLADDPHHYVYSYILQHSTIYLVEGVPHPEASR
jgi:serine/threonine protein kinase/sugar lactone lactonase YvrE